MNDNNLKYAKSERKSNKFEITKWKQIDWKKAEEFVNRLQIRIVKAERLELYTVKIVRTVPRRGENIS